MNTAKEDFELTPNGTSLIVLSSPRHFGYSGGDVANISPARGQWIGHADTSMLTGGRPESKIGEGRFPTCPVASWAEDSYSYDADEIASDSASLWNDILVTSGLRAYSHVPVGSICKSIAWGSRGSWAMIFSERGTDCHSSDIHIYARIGYYATYYQRHNWAGHDGQLLNHEDVPLYSIKYQYQRNRIKDMRLTDRLWFRRESASRWSLYLHQPWSASVQFLHPAQALSVLRHSTL